MRKTAFYDKAFDLDVDQSTVKPEYRSFAKSLHDTMHDRRMSVKELSEKTGIAQNLLSEYRNGKKFPGKPESLHKIADALGVTIDYLLGYSKVEFPDISLQEMGSFTGLSGDALFVLNEVPSAGEMLNSLCNLQNRVPFIQFCQAVSRLSKIITNTETQRRDGIKIEDYSEIMESLALSLYRVEKLYREIPIFAAGTALLNKLEEENSKQFFKMFFRLEEAQHGEHQTD